MIYSIANYIGIVIASLLGTLIVWVTLFIVTLGCIPPTKIMYCIFSLFLILSYIKNKRANQS